MCGSYWLCRLLQSGRSSGSVAEGVSGRWFGNTARRASVPLYHFFAVIALRLVEIVGTTSQLDIGRSMVATKGEGFKVVELEPFGFSAATTVLSLIGALSLVALVHRALDRGRDVARRR